MLFKKVSLELNREWVLSRRTSEKLPISTFVERCKEEFRADVEVERASLTECVLIIKDGELSGDEINSRINGILSDKLEISSPDDTARVTISDVDIVEKTDPKPESEEAPKPDKRGGLGFLSAITGQNGTTASDDGRADGVSAEEKINSLIGAESFKALAREIKMIAPRIIERKTFDAFVFQNYIFSINNGYGLSTYLNLLAEFIEEQKLFKFDSNKRVLEVKPMPPSAKTVPQADPFEAVKMHIQTYRKESALICVDISEWMTTLREQQFRDFLAYLEDHSSENIVVFRVPFVEEEVLGEVNAALRDVLFVRSITFPPMDTAELIQCAKRFLAKLNFSAEDDVWEIFETRVMEEKSDGRFYGMNTVNKIVKEMVYRKQLNDAINETDDAVIKKDDILLLSASYSDDLQSGTELLADMVGMDAIRETVEEIVAQIELSRQNKSIGAPCIHMRFVGSPGTGKTTVARIIGKILKERGILRNGSFFEYSGRDFCGRYVGETAPKTAGMCRDAYGSVLFIDEAYSLFRGADESSRDFGREALDTLIAEMENHRNDMVVIMAGYTDEMETLMKGNTGLESRMPYIIEFPNYTREQLCQIYLKMLGGGAFECDDDFKLAVKQYFDAISDEVLAAKDFSNARFVRNLFERTCAKASMRRQLERSGRLRLTAEDFRMASSERVFESLLAKKAPNRLGF